MPRSKTRHKHHSHHPNQPKHSHSQQPVVHHKPKRRSAIPIMVVFIALLGVVAAFISAGAIIVWLIAGGVAGGIIGFFIGRGMDKVAAAKK
jgi:hypothetical protein